VVDDRGSSRQIYVLSTDPEKRGVKLKKAVKNEPNARQGRGEGDLTLVPISCARLFGRRVQRRMEKKRVTEGAGEGSRGRETYSSLQCAHAVHL